MALCDSSHSPTALRRRREIAEAARAELMEKGVEGLRMRAIADRAGINIATLDYHVGGKDGLIELVAASIVEDFKAQHVNRVGPLETGLDLLAQEIRDFRDIRIKHPDIPHVMASLSRRAPNDPNIARHIVPMRAKWATLIETVLQTGQADGSLRANMDIPSAARIIIWTLLTLGSPEQLQLSFPAIATELLRAYAADPSRDFKGYFK